MKYDFSRYLNPQEVQDLSNLYTVGSIQQVGVDQPIPVEWDADRLETVLNDVVRRSSIAKEPAPEFVGKALNVIRFIGATDSTKYEQIFVPDLMMAQDIDVEIPKGKFRAKEFAMELISNYSFILHADNIYSYVGEKWRDPSGERFGGKYLLVSKNQLRRMIAARFPLVVRSVGTKAVDEISEQVMLYAPQLGSDLSEHRELLIMADGGVINAAGYSDQIFYFGSNSFYSSTLAITSAEYLAAPNGSNALITLANSQVAPDEVGRWYQSLVESCGYIIAGIPEKNFIVFQGVSSSFKSTIINVIASIWEKGAVDAQTLDQFNGKFALQNATRSAFINFADAIGGKIKPAVISLLKQITGGDYIPIHVQYNGHYSAQIEQTVVISTNNYIGLGDPAAELRAVTTPFYRSFLPQEGAPLVAEMGMERIAIFKCCLQAHFRRRFEGRPLVGYAPLNSFVQPSVGPEYWEHYIPRFISKCFVWDGKSSVFKDTIFTNFCGLMQSFLPGQEVDKDRFDRVFNEQFRSIKWNHSDSVRQVRLGNVSLKGVKGFLMDVSKF